MPTGAERPLSPKASRFVDEYLVDLNAAAAALRAGYSARTAKQMGYELLQDDRVQRAIAVARKSRVERVKVDQDYVVTNCVEVVERCMQRAPVMVREGRKMVQLVDDEDRDVWQFDSVGVMKALALLAKHTGGFVDRTELTGKDSGPVELKIVHEVIDPVNAAG
ncbi:MAG TPA: terminase small subunit [Gemmatimonadaceae bacterium]|jgi:phage terminase small subunit